MADPERSAAMKGNKNASKSGSGKAQKFLNAGMMIGGTAAGAALASKKGKDGIEKKDTPKLAAAGFGGGLAGTLVGGIAGAAAMIPAGKRVEAQQDRITKKVGLDAYKAKYSEKPGAYDASIKKGASRMVKSGAVGSKFAKATMRAINIGAQAGTAIGAAGAGAAVMKYKERKNK